MKKLLFLSLTFFTCLLSQAQKFDSAYHYKIKNFDAAIFPKEYTRYYDKNPIDKKFTPGVNEILIAYKDLKDSLMRTSNDTIKKKGANGKYHWNFELVTLLKYFNSYKWQFFGYLNNKGEKILSVISFFPDERWSSDWLIREMRMSDGGCEFWQAEYNLETHKIKFIMCNPAGG